MEDLRLTLEMEAKDNISASMRKAAAETETALTKVDTSSDSAAKTLEKTGESAGKAEEKLTKVGEAGDKTAKTLEKTGKSVEKAESELTKVDSTGEKVVKTLDKTENGFKDVGNAAGSVDRATEKVKTLNRRLEDSAEKLTRVGGGFKNFGLKSMAAGAALTAAGGVTIKAAGDFEEGMNNVSTLIDTNVENMDALKNKVLEIGRESPKPISDLTDGLYAIRSAGISADEQFKVLKGSEKLAVAGLSTTAEAVDLSTSAINAFGLKGKAVDKVYDTFFKTVKFGKTTVSEFAQGFGATAGVVASSHISIEEYSASIAALTTTGMKAGIAHTQVKAAIAGLSRGSKEQMTVFKKLGANSFTDLVDKSGGMVNAFMRINKAVGGNQSELIKLVGSVEAYNAILSLTGATHGKYKEAMQEISGGSNAIDEAYTKQTQGINAQMNRLKNSYTAVGIELGNALLPVFTKIVDAVSKFADFLTNLQSGVKTFGAYAITGIGGILTALGGFSFVTGSVLDGIGGVKKGFGILADFVGSKKGKLFNFVKKAGFEHTELELSKMFESPSRFGRKAGANGLFKSLFNDFQLIGKRNVNGLTKNLKSAGEGISRFFRGMPANAGKGLTGIKNFFTGIPANAGKGLSSVLKAIQGFSMRGFISSLFAGLRAFTTFSIGVLTNPVGLAIAGIALAALLIFKYWKPVKAFFDGVFKGIKASLAPLKPAFDKLAKVAQPVVYWFKELLKPFDDAVGIKKAEDFGYKVGRGIGWCIERVIDAVKWVKKLLTLGGRIKFGNRGALTLTEVPKPDGSHANGLQRVPFDGYIAELHRDEAVLTAGEAKTWRNGGQRGGIVINYSPTLNLSGAAASVKSDFLKELNKHKKELAKMVEDVQRSRLRGAYA